MPNRITIIVSHCRPVPYEPGNYTAYDRISEKSFDGFNPFEVAKAVRVANSSRKAGISVLLRPHYNETDEEGKRFYREWRSFDGGEFKEVRFSAW